MLEIERAFKRHAANASRFNLFPVVPARCLSYSQISQEPLCGWAGAPLATFSIFVWHVEMAI